jgi:hypothetical protein
MRDTFTYFMPYIVLLLIKHTTCSFPFQIVGPGKSFNCNTCRVYSALSLPVHDVD